MAMDWQYYSLDSVGVLHFGEQITLNGNAYLYEKGSKLCWDLDAIFLQYLWHRRAVRTWAEIQKERPMWLELFGFLGLNLDDHYFPSKRQAKMDREVRCDSYTRTCQCGSTVLVVVSLVSWATWARRLQLRERAVKML